MIKHDDVSRDVHEVTVNSELPHPVYCKIYTTEVAYFMRLKKEKMQTVSAMVSN